MDEVLGRAIWLTIRNPREGARVVLGWRLDWPEIALVLATGVAISLLVSTLVVLASAEREETSVAVAPLGILFELAQIAAIGALALWLGRLFGGRGTVIGVAAAIAWVSLVQPFVLAAVLVGVFLPPALVSLLLVGLGLWGFWILSCFIAAAHGFPNPGRVMAASFGIVVVIALVLSLLMVAAGITPPGAS